MSLARGGGDRRARSAPKAKATSDLVRGKDAWIAGGAAALAAAAAALAPTRGAIEPLGSPGPLARPHVAAKVPCSKCHDDASRAAGKVVACASGHGAPPSPRGAHARLAESGRLGCATCHPAHGGAQGVSFVEPGKAVRWGHGVERAVDTPLSVRPGQSVALVSLGACKTCHDLADPRDPAARCAGPRKDDRVSYCFDEHQRATEPARAASGACKKQHEEGRLAAWDGAREVGQRTEWLAPAPREDHPWAPIGAAAAAGSVVLAGLAGVRRLARGREGSGAPAGPTPAPAVEKRKLPVVDASRCIGCYACVDACPFDVLAIERYVAVVARPEDCCGVVLCEQACPNGSLSITTGEVREERPAVDADLQADGVPGLYVVGDLTGMPLIKNAIAQGTRAIDAIAAKRPRGGPEGAVDVVIVGAGPAGLAAALRAKDKGLTSVVLEQHTFAASIRRFPRGKLVYDPPIDLPVEGELWLEESTKEELLAQWTRIVRRHALPIREHRRVVRVDREAGGFVLTAASEDGATERIAARRVVLAIGKRGTPRELTAAIAPGAEGRVAYFLADARTWAGKRVLVVGLGDSAMEAAVALARQPGTTVTISYRGGSFARGKSRNIEEVRRMVDQGRLRVVWDSEVVRVGDGTATLRHGGSDMQLSVDLVLALIGGVPAWDLIEQSGVRRVRPASPDV